MKKLLKVLFLIMSVVLLWIASMTPDDWYWYGYLAIYALLIGSYQDDD